MALLVMVVNKGRPHIKILVARELLKNITKYVKYTLGFSHDNYK